jgi:LDH2 family malate/lactate/ureidoglycolate dehydrogenase
MANKSHYTFNETIRITYSTMADWTSRIFRATGMNREDADLVADSLVAADARGVYSHGVLRISIYTKRIEKGCVDLEAKPELVLSNGATGVVDGHNAMGQRVGYFAMKTAIEKAREFGVSFVTARGGNHYGTCAYYTMMALPEDMIGFSASIGGGNLMAPWGGTDARVGNNPFSVAIPALTRHPVVLDMAQSVVAKGKLVMATKTRSSIPDTWAFDADGQPTTDAEEGIRGTIRPIANYKGYGLAVVVGFLSSVISNGAIGASLKDVYGDFSGGLNKGQLFAAVDIGRMSDVQAFKERMDREIAFIKASPKAPGVTKIYLPGELEAIAWDQSLIGGIEYPVEVIAEMRDISERLGVSAPYFA